MLVPFNKEGLMLRHAPRGRGLDSNSLVNVNRTFEDTLKYHSYAPSDYRNRNPFFRMKSVKDGTIYCVSTHYFGEMMENLVKGGGVVKGQFKYVCIGGIAYSIKIDRSRGTRGQWKVPFSVDSGMERFDVDRVRRDLYGHSNSDRLTFLSSDTRMSLELQLREIRHSDTSCYVVLTDVSHPNRNYYMFISDFNEVVRRKKNILNGGLISGIFTFRKCGEYFGIKLCPPGVR